MLSLTEIVSIVKDLALIVTNVTLAILAFRQARTISRQVEATERMLYAQNAIGINCSLVRQTIQERLWLAVENSGPATALNVICNIHSQNGKIKKGFHVGPLSVKALRNLYINKFQNLYPTIVEAEWKAINPLGQEYTGHTRLKTAEARTTDEQIS